MDVSGCSLDPLHISRGSQPKARGYSPPDSRFNRGGAYSKVAQD